MSSDVGQVIQRVAHYDLSDDASVMEAVFVVARQLKTALYTQKRLPGPFDAIRIHPEARPGFVRAINYRSFFADALTQWQVHNNAIGTIRLLPVLVDIRIPPGIVLGEAVIPSY